MSLHDLLLKYNFTIGPSENDLWIFIGFNHNSSKPLKMQRLSDSHTGIFDFEDLEITEIRISNLQILTLEEKIKNDNKLYKKAEEQRHQEWIFIKNELKNVGISISDLLKYFDKMSIELIKEKLLEIRLDIGRS